MWRQISPHGILPALDSQGDLLNSDFRHSARVDASTQRRGEQLRTETHSPHRDVALDQIANVFDLGCQPLDLALIADAIGPPITITASNRRSAGSGRCPEEQSARLRSSPGQANTPLGGVHTARVVVPENACRQFLSNPVPKAYGSIRHKAHRRRRMCSALESPLSSPPLPTRNVCARTTPLFDIDSPVLNCRSHRTQRIRLGVTCRVLRNKHRQRGRINIHRDHHCNLDDSTTTTQAPLTTSVIGTTNSPLATTPVAAEVTPAAAPAIMPNVVCMNLQDAQDTIQSSGVFFSRSADATGAGRRQLVDSNWIVVDQTPSAGSPFGGEIEAVLSAVKIGEPNPC